MNTDACMISVRRALTGMGVRTRDGLLVGVSGGPDSVALLHMLHQMNAYTLYAAHFHHGIRGENADEDAAFVRALCESLHVPYYEERADVPAMARARGMSLEEAARDARYAYLGRVKEECGARFILTAHHRDDQAETVLMHMLRGCGLNGLCGMRPLTGDLARPLLQTSRRDILEYLAHRGIAYRTDQTNLEPVCTRNRIRLALLPALESYNPGIAKSLADMAALLRIDEDCLAAQAENALQNACIGENRYNRAALLVLHPAIRSRAILQAMAHAGIAQNREGAARVTRLLDSRTGQRVSLPGGAQAEASYDALIFTRKPEPLSAFETVLNVPGETITPRGRFIVSAAAALRRDEGAYVAYIDADSLPDEVCVRQRRDGDRFFPLGAPGGKKLKQYLIDKKIDGEARRAPLLAHGEQVLFFPGGTVAHTLSVTEATRRIWRVEYIR